MTEIDVLKSKMKEMQLVKPLAFKAAANDARSQHSQLPLSDRINRKVILYCTFDFAYNVRTCSHIAPAAPTPFTNQQHTYILCSFLL